LFPVNCFIITVKLCMVSILSIINLYVSSKFETINETRIIGNAYVLGL